MSDIFDSLYRVAAEEGVAVDELESFSKEQPHCHECGSYDLVAFLRRHGKSADAATYVSHYRCEDCGSKVRNVRKEEMEGKTWHGEGLYWK